MVLKKSIGATLLFGLLSGVELAAAGGPPSIDRPTPPPCCADGICYPNCTTFGVYPTRWRRWPTAYEEAAGVQPPAPLGPDIQPYSPPSAEEEDRRAPPPSNPPRPQGAEAAPPRQAPAEGPAQGQPQSPIPPQSESDDLPPSPIFGEPVEETPRTAPLESTPPSESMPDWDRPFGSDALPTTPTSSVDLPPGLPFRSPGIIQRPDARSASHRVLSPAPRADRGKRAVSGEDPPPAPPIAMLSLAD